MGKDSTISHISLYDAFFQLGSWSSFARLRNVICDVHVIFISAIGAPSKHWKDFFSIIYLHISFPKWPHPQSDFSTRCFITIISIIESCMFKSVTFLLHCRCIWSTVWPPKHPEDFSHSLYRYICLKRIWIYRFLSYVHPALAIIVSWGIYSCYIQGTAL